MALYTVARNFAKCWTIFGRPFVKLFALLCHRTVVCLSVCLSCNIVILWPNGWMDQDATWYRGRPRSRRHCVRWGLSYFHGKGTAAPPTSRPMSTVAKRSPISATAKLLSNSFTVRLSSKSVNPNILFVAELTSLESRRDRLSRSFVQDFSQPASSLCDLLFVYTWYICLFSV